MRFRTVAGLILAGYLLGVAVEFRQTGRLLAWRFTEPELAAAVATKASNSDNFTAALVENVNSAGAELVASGLITQETLDSIPVINVSEVVVEEPVIETVIEYTIAIETADPELGEEVRFV